MKYPFGGTCQVCGITRKSGRVEVAKDSNPSHNWSHKVCLRCQRIYAREGLLLQLGYITWKDIPDE